MGVLAPLRPYPLVSILYHIDIPASFVSFVPPLFMSIPTLQFAQSSIPGMIAMTSKCRDKNEPSKQSSHQLLLPHLTKICPSHMEHTKWSWNPFIGEEESLEFEEALLQDTCNCKSIPTVEPTSKHSPWYCV